MLHWRPITILTVAFLAVSGRAVALDLGTIGPVYPIKERDLLVVMQDKMRALEKSGELGQIQERYKREVIGSVESPRPVAGIQPTATARTFYIDPSHVLERHVLDDKGRILYPAGTRVNPLDYAPMTKLLLFFDARDKAQIAFAKRFIAETKQQVKPILVAGEPMKLMREWKQQVYYDQGGTLSRRFMLQQTPAIVSQEDKRLRVDEIRP
jgi:conjugal transfer pilus assembly protein TraW